MPDRIKDMKGQKFAFQYGCVPQGKQDKRRKKNFKKPIFIFLVIGMILLFRHNLIQIEITTSSPKATIVGEGVFIQTYEKCRPRVKVAFSLPECRFIDKTGKGYLIKIPKYRAGLEIITFKPRITIAGRNVFVQSLERCRPRFKLSFL